MYGLEPLPPLRKILLVDLFGREFYVWALWDEDFQAWAGWFYTEDKQERLKTLRIYWFGAWYREIA